ncbi:MAG: hypothetical protein ACRDHW_10320, partial [Ktedonobacteraceae bacterium]
AKPSKMETGQTQPSLFAKTAKEDVANKVDTLQMHILERVYHAFYEKARLENDAIIPSALDSSHSQSFL